VVESRTDGEVPVHLGHRLLVEGEERGAVGLAGAGPLLTAASAIRSRPIIAPRRRSLTGGHAISSACRCVTASAAARRTEWSGAFSRMSRARSRVGRMFSSRFTPLMTARCCGRPGSPRPPTASEMMENDRSSANAVSRSVRNRSRYTARCGLVGVERRARSRRSPTRTAAAPVRRRHPSGARSVLDDHDVGLPHTCSSPGTMSYVRWSRRSALTSGRPDFRSARKRTSRRRS